MNKPIGFFLSVKMVCKIWYFISDDRSTFKTYQLWLLSVILPLWKYISFRISVPFILQNIISDHNINHQSAIFYQFSFYQWSHFSKKYQFNLLSVISTLLKCISYQLSVVPNFQILSVAYISALIKKRPTDKKKPMPSFVFIFKYVKNDVLY